MWLRCLACTATHTPLSPLPRRLGPQKKGRTLYINAGVSGEDNEVVAGAVVADLVEGEVKERVKAEETSAYKQRLATLSAKSSTREGGVDAV